MNKEILYLVEKLEAEHSLSLNEYTALIKGYNDEASGLLRELAVKERKAYYGNKIFIRGLIEISNVCKNDCYYCGIRRSNNNVERYRLDGKKFCPV